MMKCQHLTKTGRACNNQIIGNSQYCYLKSHHPTEDGFQIAKTKIVDHFKYSTYDPDDFHIRNVDGDGACLYRSFAQAIFKRLTCLEQHPLYPDIRAVVGEENCDEFLDENTETTLADFLQKNIKEWLYEKQNQIIKELDCKIKDLVYSTHEMSMDIYRVIYDIFAGEPDFLIVEKEANHSLTKIPNRWGGAPEQYAFSAIFNIPINIYELITLDRRKFNVKQASFRHKLRRMRLLQSFNAQSKDDLDASHFYFTTVKGTSHYMYMHPIA